MSFNKSLITRLKTLIKNSGSEERIEEYEDDIVKEIEKFIKEESFFELPTNEVLRIFGKSKIGDLELICEFISRMSENKGKKSILLLNFIKREEASLEECVKILSMFKHSQICQRTSQFFFEDNVLPERDYEGEIAELRKENEELQDKTKEKKTYFPPVTEKPPDFESNIFKAAEEGKLTSIQYLVEQGDADVETKDEYGNSPINIASEKGHLDIVKYLYEACRANVETKNDNGFTPINRAARYGHLEIVKYLYETCHANVEVKDNFDRTPINWATLYGHLEVVKYLYETCHTEIADEMIDLVRTDEIKNYLSTIK